MKQYQKIYTILLVTLVATTAFFTLSHAEKEKGETASSNDAVANGKAAEKAAEKPRRLEVLFLGSNPGSHRPIERFKTIRRALGVKGINFTYANEPTALNKENLAKYDALLVYGNHDVISKEQEKALLDYSTNGGACVFLHSACGCFRNSEPFIKLLGAQFKSHGGEVFKVKTVLPNHEVMKGYEGFECWDETYVHQKHNQDRTILQKREEEPWTWVRTNGKGRIFYTASGHDHRCWQLENYHDLVYRGIMWSVGDQKAKLVKDLKLPTLTYYKSKVNVLPKKSYGVPLDRRVPHDVLQNPLSVEDSIKLAQVPVGFELQVFASEPDIVNPIALNWDEKGRLWAVEAYDYPNSYVMNSPGKDRIKILEDTDGDGKADKISVFADGLTICTSVLPVKGGCITTDGEEMILLTDTNGDGKADKRKVIFKGIKLWDTHACVSNLHYGFDGWIYATVGYSGLEITLSSKKHKNKYKSSQGVFRFKQDGSDFEFIQGTSNNTWGLDLTAEGNIVGSTANGNPSWYVDMPNRYLKGTGVKPKRTPRADSKEPFYPLTFDYLQVDVKESVTAGAGHSIYNASLFPKEWWGQRAFICAPTGKMVVAPRFETRGAGFKTYGFENNIYATADSWSAPVAVEVGPDGAVYIADWYNSIVQHNVYGNEQKKGIGNAYITEHRDRKHGRIYRIAPKGAKPKAYPKLSNVEEQLQALGNDNLFWRLTAQRLLLENKRPSFDQLNKLIESDTVSSIHALHILAQVADQKQLSEQSQKALESKTSGLSVAAIGYLEKSEAIAKSLLAKVDGADVHVQKATLLYFASLPKSSDLLGALKRKKGVFQKDKTLLHSLTVALAKHGANPNTVNEKKRHFALSESAKRGEKVYKQATCVACHQPGGEGVAGTFPPLNKSEWLTRSHEDAIKTVLYGLEGEIMVRGKKYKGGMPEQSKLSDQEVTDVLNYVRNSWDNSLGDITKGEVTRVRAKYKGRKSPFKAEDFKKPIVEATHHYDFRISNKDQLGNAAEAIIKGRVEAAKQSKEGIDLTANTGEKCNAIKNDSYVDLPNKMISNVAKDKVMGELSIEIWLKMSENRPWAEAWNFGDSVDGEDKSRQGKDYIILIPQNRTTGKLRLAARAGGKEHMIDGKTALELNKLHHLVATYDRANMYLYLNGKLVGKTQLPPAMDLTKINDVNNWLGRSQFPDPTFDGVIRSVTVHSTKLSKENVQAAFDKGAKK